MAANSPKYFPLPISITPVLFRFRFNQRFFMLISTKHWAILVIVVWPYVAKNGQSYVSAAPVAAQVYVV